MSENRNVNALEAVLVAYWYAPEGERGPLSSFLAARGVLAIDALTDADCAKLVWTQSIHEEPTELRAALRRCATGEDT